MENFEEKINEQPDKYELLRAELEEAKSGETQNHLAHFEDINISELGEKDLDVYEKFRDQKLTREEFEAYRREFFAVEKKEKSVSRADFAAWLVNKLWLPKNLKWYDKKTYESYVSQGLIPEVKDEEQKKTEN